MILIIEPGIRGGIFQCSHRYEAGYNKYMTHYDERKPILYIAYIDMNNLYGNALSRKLPFRNFKWVDPNDYGDTDKYGYIVDGYLKYPKYLYDEHNDLQFAPEKNIPPNKKIAKLLLTFNEKKNYILHYKNLKFYLDLGIKEARVNRMLQFEKRNFIKPYIDLNTSLSQKANNNFKKDFYKFMNNSVFGRTMENVRNRQKIYLCTSVNEAVKKMNRAGFKKGNIFFKTTCKLMAVHRYQSQVKFDKPILDSLFQK